MLTDRVANVFTVALQTL